MAARANRTARAVGTDRRNTRANNQATLNNNSINSLNTKSIIQNLTTNNDSLIYNLFISNYYKYLPNVIINLGNPVPTRYNANKIDMCYEEECISGVFTDFMNINIAEGKEMTLEKFINYSFNPELHRTQLYTKELKFLSLSKFSSISLHKYIKAFNKLLQYLYGVNEFPDLGDGELIILEFFFEIGKKHFLSDDIVKGKISPKLLKILNCIIFLNQGLLANFNNEVEKDSITLFTFISSEKVLILDKENKILSFVGYLRENINYGGPPLDVVRGIVILTVDINRIEKDVHFVYIPIYNCIRSLPISRLTNGTNNNKIYFEKFKIYTDYLRIIFNKTNNINIINCLDYKHPNILLDNSRDPKIIELKNIILNHGLLKYNPAISSIDCSDSPLDGLITLINNYLNSEGNEKKIFEKIAIEFMIAINGNILKEMLRKQEAINVEEKFNLFDVIRINGENMYYYKCSNLASNLGLYEEIKYKFPSNITTHFNNFSYTFIITSNDKLDSEMEKPMSAEEIKQLIQIVHTNSSEDTSFYKLIVKDFKKSYIYLSSFNTRNILALSIINYFIDNDIGNTWKILPNKIKITNWYKVLKLYYITNFLLNLNHLRRKSKVSKEIIENIDNLIELSKSFPGLGLGVLGVIKTQKYLNTKTDFNDYLSVLLLEPKEFNPTNYFDKDIDIMDLFMPDISDSTNSTAGGSRKKVRKTKKYNSRAKKHTKRR
jgi:hypothetical protein